MGIKSLCYNEDAMPLGWVGGLVSQYIGLFAFEIIGDVITGFIAGGAGVYVGSMGCAIGAAAGVINFIVSGLQWIAGLLGFG